MISNKTEDLIEQAYWEFDSERCRSGAERDAFKRQMRSLYAEAFRDRRANAMGMSREVLDASGY